VIPLVLFVGLVASIVIGLVIGTALRARADRD